MTGHPTDHEIERYAARTLEPAALLSVDDHLAVCLTCRQRAVSAASTAQRLASAVDSIQCDLSNADVEPAAPTPMTRLARWAALGAAAAAALFIVNIVWGTRAGTPVAQAPPVATAPAPVTPPTTPPAPPPADTLTAAERARVDAVIADGRLARPRELDPISAPKGQLMGSPAAASSFGPLRPLGVIVDTDRPTLEWESAGRGAEYRVAIFDEAFEPVARSDWQKSTTWTVPLALRRGKTYTWQITARVEGRETTAPAPPLPEARFIVTSVERSLELAEMRRRAGDSHLALAVLLASAGVLDEAEKELTIASTANPDSSAVKRVRASIAALRRP